jgi:tRNA threonylcarbamoyl adenosine modification protein (Sua5/YciO/YrdC/YwlC family)
MVILKSLHDPQLASLYAGGAVGVIPTDTIYGLSASAHIPEAVDRLYALKQREQKPGTVIAASVEQLRELGLAPEDLNALQHLWPNPLSIELPTPEKLRYLSQGTGHCAFRVVADPEVRALLELTGPLVTSSANHPGKPAANNIAEALVYFSNKVDLYVDGGERIGRPPSTVARLKLPVDGTLEIVRMGAVNITEKGEIL